MTDKQPCLWLIGAHGGAGVTTLAHVWAPAGEATDRGDAPGMSVVVCSATVEGLAAARKLIVDEGQDVLGVVMVNRLPGKPAREVVKERQKVEALTSVWEVPFVKKIAITRLDEIGQWTPSTEVSSRSLRGKDRSPVEALGRVGGQVCRAYAWKQVGNTEEK